MKKLESVFRDAVWRGVEEDVRQALAHRVYLAEIVAAQKITWPESQQIVLEYKRAAKLINRVMRRLARSESK